MQRLYTLCVLWQYTESESQWSKLNHDFEQVDTNEHVVSTMINTFWSIFITTSSWSTGQHVVNFCRVQQSSSREGWAEQSRLIANACLQQVAYCRFESISSGYVSLSSHNNACALCDRSESYGSGCCWEMTRDGNSFLVLFQKSIL